MPENNPGAEQINQGQAAAPIGAASGGVDLQALAEKILALLKDELRIESQRRGPGG